jgi:hypothetical protein
MEFLVGTGVFHRQRYDNLTSAVKKILRGYQREETARFIAFRSHAEQPGEFLSGRESIEILVGRPASPRGWGVWTTNHGRDEVGTKNNPAPPKNPQLAGKLTQDSTNTV